MAEPVKRVHSSEVGSQTEFYEETSLWSLQNEPGILFSTHQVLLGLAQEHWKATHWIFDASSDSWIRLGLHPFFRLYFESYEKWKNHLNYKIFETPEEPLWIFRVQKDFVGPLSTPEALTYLRKTPQSLNLKIWQKGWSEWRFVYEVFPGPLLRSFIPTPRV